ncbi:MAG: radical SAM protein [Desulfamplus sp.]|nr:radical SAM protein [Desulfamplus sp.]
MSHSPSPPLVIPIFIPHAGCLHQCAFCNQKAITSLTGITMPDSHDIHKIVNAYLLYKGAREQVEMAFFGGNFLGLSRHKMTALLDTARNLVKSGQIHGIRFSTRPDTITEKNLETIAHYPVSTVELGVQSMNDQVLRAVERGHTEKDTIKAMQRLREFLPVCKTGIQMMVGLPRESEVMALEGARRAAALAPDFVRIYPLLVLEGSLMANWYRKGIYTPLNLENAVTRVKKLYMIFESQNIKVIRMGLQASDIMEDNKTVLAGPWHPAFGHLVHSEIFLDMAVTQIRDKIENFPLHNDRYMDAPAKSGANVHPTEFKNPLQTPASQEISITLSVHPSSLSKLKGDKNRNMSALTRIFPSINININVDKKLDKNQILIEHL